MIRFLKTKIGVSLLIAVVIIGLAIELKHTTLAPKTNLQAQVGLIADTSVKNAIASGELPSWEKTLGLNSTSTDITKNNSIGDINASTTNKELTATDRFAQTFFTKYIELKKSGATIDQNTGTNLVNQLLSQDYGSAPEEKTYTESDMKVLNTTSLDAIKKYGNELGAIIQSPTPIGYEQELMIVAKVNDTGDTTDLDKLPMNVAHYQKIRDQILALYVPRPLINDQVNLINSLSSMLEGVKGMILIKTDPVGATKMIAKYQDGFNSISMPLLDMKTYFNKQNISFSSNESGYILVQ